MNTSKQVEEVFKDCNLVFDPDAKWKSIGSPVDRLQLILKLERRFSIDIPDEDIVRFKQVSDVVKFFESEIVI